jgi:putative ubiquitin-RnfH superfamily antitoxin RatB of RatAB toxin-antitoxin module
MPAKTEATRFDQAASDRLAVEVCWVRSSPADGTPCVRCEALRLKSPATVADAVSALGDPRLLQELSDGRLRAAVFGQSCGTDRVLVPGDRVELLGPILVDPKLARARRAQVQRARKGDHRWGV